MIELKRDPYIFVLYVLLILVGGFLLYQGVVTWREVEGFALGVLLPSALGWKKQAGDVRRSVTAKTVKLTEKADEEKEEKKEEKAVKDDGEDKKDVSDVTPALGTPAADEPSDPKP